MTKHAAPGTLHAAPGTLHESPESDTAMTGTYVGVIVVEVVIVVALWFFGRAFS